MQYKPSAFFNIVLMAGLKAFTPFGRSITPAGAFGPCITCRRDDYFAIGGHEKVKNEVLEDMSLGRLFSQRGLSVNLYGGNGAVFFRMYPGGLGELVEGWSKGFATGALSIGLTFFLLIAMWITGCFSAGIGLVRASISPLPDEFALAAAIYVLYAAEIRWMLRRIGSFHILTAILFPIPLAFFAVILLRSFLLAKILRRVIWRGRIVSTRSGDTKK